MPLEESFRKTPLEYKPENRRAQEIGSSSRTAGLTSAPSQADSWEASQINKIRSRSNSYLDINVKSIQFLTNYLENKLCLKV